LDDGKIVGSWSGSSFLEQPLHGAGGKLDQRA
jgi:hypothetical protein